jgi:hypothetical protein
VKIDGKKVEEGTPQYKSIKMKNPEFASKEIRDFSFFLRNLKGNVRINGDCKFIVLKFYQLSLSIRQ